VEALHLADENGTPICCVIAKSSFPISERGLLPGKTESLLASGLKVSADAWGSYRYEPETAFVKPATDIVLVGHAHAPKGGATMVDVGLKVGPVQKVVRVFGDRYWVKTGGQVFASRPHAFQTLPLTYERAFGGWDKSNKDETKWTYEPRNPAGRGFGDPLRYVEEGKVPMPNIEDPSHLIGRYGDAPPPAGFGFTSPNWQPRVKLAGTYDDAWSKQRKPLLPKDFDRRFFNAASPGLIAPGYLKGDEEVIVVNAAPTTPLKLRLPGMPAPIFRVVLHGDRSEILRTNLDTVIVDTDAMVVTLLWRAYAAVPDGAPDVVAIETVAERGVTQVTTP
jgi:hypothetical protein